MRVSIWTDEKIEILKAKRAEGLSCGVIAAEFGVTRNAVIGKCGRLGIIGANLSHATAPRVRLRLGRTVTARPKIIKSQGPEIIALPPEPPQCEPVLFIDTRIDDCRWPVDGEGVAMLCCGAETVPAMSYCAHHQRKSWRHTA